jgi:hypothetical protein
MSSGTGENEAGLRKILDFTRLGAILVLLLHCYFYCYGAFERWGLSSPWGDQFLQNIALTGLYSTVWKSKLIALGLLGISLLGAKGQKIRKHQPPIHLGVPGFGLEPVLLQCT